jgi:2-dehydropantoate 2-reductase
MPGRIGVLGAGGMGSAFAAFLARAGADVVLIGRGSAHIRAVAAGPLRVLPPAAAPWTARVPAAVGPDDLAPSSVDVLIVLTKTFDSPAAVSGVAHALVPDGVAVSLQNGLGNDAVLSETVGGGRSLVGVTTVGATLQEPGTISISASTAAGQSESHVGAMGSATAAARADDVAAALSAAGLPAVHVEQVAVPLWGKLALSVMSPVSSVVRLTVGRVWATPQGRSLVERMFDEVVTVAAGQGVVLDRDAAWAHACRVFAGTGEHYTSMCTDVLKGRRTELASMAGAVQRLAEETGTPVPVHATVLALLGTLGVEGA